jgi:hypothetical protein
LVVKLSAPKQHLSADWKVLLREGSSYVRQELTLHAEDQDVFVKEIILFDQAIKGAKTVGKVDGSPVVADTFFVGYEHPMAHNTVSAADRVQCSYVRNAILKSGETLSQSLVIGTVPRGQLRRGFLSYVERERAHPYRPFLYYDAWFDISFATRKYDEADSLNVIDQFAQELVKRRGVHMDAFLMDDGWDNSQTLWKFHSGFPNGFTPLKKNAGAVGAGIGVWVSPFGGFDERRPQRLKYGSEQGFETNAYGFSLAGPKYYQRFHDICMEMVQKYGVIQFKFDGIAANSLAGTDGHSLTRDGDAMLRLIGDLRAERPDIYINQTTGTWPSPFWLLYVDSTWRGGMDHSFTGKGSDRQQWITYRDARTYENVVEAGPLYPLNSIMLHGVIFATYGEKLEHTDDQDFADEVHSYFGSGTQLQELYLTPKLLKERNWDDLAEAAEWSRTNSGVLVDTHWIGGDPGKGEVYGWASWSPRKGVIVLRNPDDKPANFTADIAQLFELPANGPKTFQLKSPWQKDRDLLATELNSGQSHTFNLQPYQVLVFDAQPGGTMATPTAEQAKAVSGTSDNESGRSKLNSKSSSTLGAPSQQLDAAHIIPLK